MDIPLGPLEALSQQHCDTGENPYYNPLDKCAWWTDIPAGKLYRYDFATKQTKLAYTGDPVGGFTLQEDGKLLLFRVKDIATLDDQGHVKVLMEHGKPEIQRFNDVIAGPDGRVYAGTMASSKNSGGLYRIDLDGSVTQMWLGTNTANGSAFSLDETSFFWTDTTNGTISKFKFDKATGQATDRQVWWKVPQGEGGPDGCAMDEHENIWSAQWGGSKISIINPAGERIGEVKFPTGAVSSCCFGGESRDELIVTTAQGKPGSDKPDGTLYRVKVGVRGRPVFKSRILL